MKYTEFQIVRKWKRGELSYAELLALKKEGLLHVRKLNKNVKLPSAPEGSKKYD